MGPAVLRVVRKSIPGGENSASKAAGAHGLCGKASVAGTVRVTESTLEDGVGGHHMVAACAPAQGEQTLGACRIASPSRECERTGQRC